MFDYRNLRVWCRARDLVWPVYELTAGCPDTERFGLISQTRRASISVAAHLAEGSGRRGSREFERFVDIAIGSAFELECHLVLANDLDMISDVDLEAMSSLKEIKRIGLARNLQIEASG